MAVKPAENIDESAFAPAFADMDRGDLESFAAAGEEVLEIRRLLSKTGDNVVGEVLRDQGTFYEWNHYPDGDVYDGETGSQFFYHAHPADLRVGEHGHFHTFLRPAGMPDGAKPAAVADLEMPKDANDALSHLIGISMDSAGDPICLFTTNRWVTGEIWYGAEDVVEFLKLFEISHTRPSWPVNRWLNAMVRFYEPEIIALIRERDVTVAQWADKNPSSEGVYEDRKLEVTSFKTISVPDRLDAIRTILG